MNATSPQVNIGRKYKSRKQRPCDACRKRKICCTRDAFETACSLCKTRGEICQYILPPNIRKNRRLLDARGQVGVATSPTASSSSFSSNKTQSRQFQQQQQQQYPRYQQNKVQRDGKGVSAAKKEEWICQFVGFSGDQDPFVLRHCNFNHLNCYKASDSAILRIKSDDGIPIHFNIIPDNHVTSRPDYYPIVDLDGLVGPYGNELFKIFFQVVNSTFPLLDRERFFGGWENGDPLVVGIFRAAVPFLSIGNASKDEIEGILERFLDQALPIESQHPRLETLETLLLHCTVHV